MPRKTSISRIKRRTPKKQDFKFFISKWTYFGIWFQNVFETEWSRLILSLEPLSHSKCSFFVKNVFVLAILACSGVQVAFQRNWKLSRSTHNKKCTFSCAIEHNLNCFYMLFEKGPADIFIMTSNSPISLQIAVNNTGTLGNLVWLKQLSHKHCTL